MLKLSVEKVIPNSSQRIRMACSEKNCLINGTIKHSGAFVWDIIFDYFIE